MKNNPKTCVFCGGVFLCHDFEKGFRKYCSRACSNRGSFSGNKSPKWTGGRNVSKKFYVRLRINRSLVPEHRAVMENFIERKLESEELVHHKNGDKHDNRIENLEIIRRSDHCRIHHTGKKSPESQKEAMRIHWKRRNYKPYGC